MNSGSIKKRVNLDGLHSLDISVYEEKKTVITELLTLGEEPVMIYAEKFDTQLLMFKSISYNDSNKSYFKDDYLIIIDESHMTIPQIGAMYSGDRSRKTTLVDYGFRLPSALDNRPLAFTEFEEHIDQMLIGRRRFGWVSKGNLALECRIQKVFITFHLHIAAIQHKLYALFNALFSESINDTAGNKYSLEILQ